jgi:hypothetical protein
MKAIFPKEYTYFLPRDESIVLAAHSLAAIARDAQDRREAAAILQMAAVLLPAVYKEEADQASWALYNPENAYEAILAVVIDHAAAFQTAVEKRYPWPLEHLRNAERVANFSRDTAWLAHLIREIHEAFKRCWGGVEPPERLPDPPDPRNLEPESNSESEFDAPKM